MGSAVTRLLDLVEATDRFDIPLAEIRATQIEAGRWLDTITTGHVTGVDLKDVTTARRAR